MRCDENGERRATFTMLPEDQVQHELNQVKRSVVGEWFRASILVQWGVCAKIGGCPGIRFCLSVPGGDSSQSGGGKRCNSRGAAGGNRVKLDESNAFRSCDSRVFPAGG